MVYIYVDDILLFGPSSACLSSLKERFSLRFKCKDLGSSKRFLGVWIVRDTSDDVLRLHQESYCREIGDRFAQWFSIFATPKTIPLPEDIQGKLSDVVPEPVSGDA